MREKLRNKDIQHDWEKIIKKGDNDELLKEIFRIELVNIF